MLPRTLAAPRRFEVFQAQAQIPALEHQFFDGPAHDALYVRMRGILEPASFHDSLDVELAAHAAKLRGEQSGKAGRRLAA